MPTYEYRCAAGHHFEQFQRMNEAPVDRCPECGEPAERLLSAGAGLLFKGSGFYITDYRSDSYRKAAAAESGSGGGAGKGAGGAEKGSGGAEKGGTGGEKQKGASASAKGGSKSGAAESKGSGGSAS
jgi:putative FmdB family regulatory protein